MKVVINKCYGGFSLSPAAVERLAQLQGRRCYFFEFDAGSMSGEKYTRIPLPSSRSLSWIAFDTPKPPIAPPGDASRPARVRFNTLYNKHHLDNSPKDRADPLLVQVVEELGAEANGAHADLAVIEIPDGVEWTIEEYDGQEWVSEKHRTWS